MRVGLYGGSFDPVHQGHVAPILDVLDDLALERVIYLPTGAPPHKVENPPVAPSVSRFAMVEMALLDEPKLVVSAHEIDDRQLSFTIDTIEHFRRRFPSDELVLLIGTDSFVQFSSWRRWREILAEAEIAVLNRPGWKPSLLPVELRRAIDRGRVRFVDNRRVAVSSSEIRKQLRSGERPTEVLSPLVLDYIGKYELYGYRPE